MSSHKGLIERSLTVEQQEQMRKQATRKGESLQLDIMELEERIAPGYRTP